MASYTHTYRHTPTPAIFPNLIHQKERNEQKRGGSQQVLDRERCVLVLDFPEVLKGLVSPSVHVGAVRVEKTAKSLQNHCPLILRFVSSSQNNIH